RDGRYGRSADNLLDLFAHSYMHVESRPARAVAKRVAHMIALRATNLHIISGPGSVFEWITEALRLHTSHGDRLVAALLYFCRMVSWIAMGVWDRAERDLRLAYEAARGNEEMTTILDSHEARILAHRRPRDARVLISASENAVKRMRDVGHPD